MQHAAGRAKLIELGVESRTHSSLIAFTGGWLSVSVVTGPAVLIWNISCAFPDPASVTSARLMTSRWISLVPS